MPLAFKLARTSFAPRIAVKAIGLAPEQVPSVMEQVAIDDDQPNSRNLRIEIGGELLAAADRPAPGRWPRHWATRTGPSVVPRHRLSRNSERKSRAMRWRRPSMRRLPSTTRGATRPLPWSPSAQSAKAAVPGLIRDLEKGQVAMLITTNLRYSCRAAKVLATIPESLPALIEGLDSDKPMVRIGCVWAMPTDKTIRPPRSCRGTKNGLARSTPGGERELIVERLSKLDPDWVRQAVARANLHEDWPTRHWHNVADAVAAMAKAEVAKEAEHDR